MITRQQPIMRILVQILLFIGLTALAKAAPAPQDDGAVAASSYWLSSIERKGAVPFGKGGDYQVFRNVKDFGAKGKSAKESIGIDSLTINGPRYKANYVIRRRLR